MMARFSIYRKALLQVFNKKSSLITLPLLAFLLFSIFIYIPIKNIPGNDLAFQLSTLRLKDYLLLISLSTLSSLSLLVNFYLFKNGSFSSATASSGQSGLGVVSGTLASIFGTATCAACVASLFGFLGASTVFILLDYRWYVVSFSILILLVSLYFSSKKVLKVCENCNKIGGHKRH